MKATKYVGWVYGTAEDVSRLREFGFTGEMIYRCDTSGERPREVIEHVHATEEVMEKACKYWPNFNCGSFTGLDENGNQNGIDQIYWKRAAG